MPEPDCFLRYRISAATQNFITSGKSHVYVLTAVAAARRGFKMVLFTASRRNTFVGGTCALPSTECPYGFVCGRLKFLRLVSLIKTTLKSYLLATLGHFTSLISLSLRLSLSPLFD